MSAMVTVEEAQINFQDLIHQVALGQEIIIIQDQQPVARLVSERRQPRSPLRPPPGLGRGMITIIADDEEHLKDFAEYMP